METEEKKTVDMLTPDSVSVLTQKIAAIDGAIYTLGNHRRAYVNSARGREEIVTEQPGDVVAAVMAIWGDTVTVTELMEPADGQ